jgi:hypothetical protein
MEFAYTNVKLILAMHINRTLKYELNGL